jgi:hypothetical protein
LLVHYYSLAYSIYCIALVAMNFTDKMEFMKN